MTMGQLGSGGDGAPGSTEPRTPEGKRLAGPFARVAESMCSQLWYCVHPCILLKQEVDRMAKGRTRHTSISVWTQ